MIGLIIMVGLLVALCVWSVVALSSLRSRSRQVRVKEITKSDLEQDARRDWDEQVKALGGSDPELYFSKPNLSGERPIFNAGGLTFEEYHAAALERFYAFSEGGVLDPSLPTTNELNS